MTKDEYAKAYQGGFGLTIRFLVSKGLAYETARETAQAAWARGWERLGQLRNPSMILTWMNSIALNLHRSAIRREPLLESLPEISTSPRVNLAAIDVRRILENCRQSDRLVLEWHYLEGCKIEEIARHQGCTETAVRIRLLRARRSVGRRMEGGRARVSPRRPAEVSASIAALPAVALPDSPRPPE